MRPRLREDVRFVESPDGAYIHGDHGTCTLRGNQAFALLSRLAPALDGRRTLAELTAGLSEDRRDIVERLIRSLAELRFVVDNRGSRPHGLTAAERDVYADEISFIGYAHDSPEWRFERLRRARAVLVGEGPLLAAVLEACVRSGWKRLRVLTTGTTSGGGDAVALRDVVERARRDPEQAVRIEAADDPAAAGLDAIADRPDLVLQIARDPADLIATARACREADVPLGQALVRPAEVWLTAVGPIARTEAESGWRRLGALPHATSAHTGEDWLIGPVPAVVAAMLALAAFSHLTGMDSADPEDRYGTAVPGRPDHAANAVPHPPAAVPYASPGGAPPGDGAGPALTRVDLRNLDTFRHRFLPHPGADHRSCPGHTPEDVCAAVDALAAAVPIGRDRLLERTGEIVDARLGLLGLLDEQDLAQTPLAVCRATVSDPFGVLPGWAPPPEVVGWGEDRPTARARCLLAALATYGALAAHGARTAAAADMVWGVEVPTGRPRAVPIGVPGPVGTRYRAPAGVAAGLSWAEAVAAGLRAHCEAHLAALDPDDLPVVQPPSGHLGRQLELTGEAVEVRDATAALGVPAFRFGVPGRPAVVSAAATHAAALLDGRERVLLGWQARTTGQLAYADPGPTRFPGHAAGDPPPDDPYGVRLMAEALRATGRVPVAIPLDHDPELARLLPFLVQVVLADD